MYLIYIDIIKGVCMLLVLVDHSGISLPPMLDYIEVPSFFIVSGFLYKDVSLKNILQKKAFRLIVPYFFFAFLYAVPFVLKTLPFDDEFCFYKAIVWFLIAPANNPLWFLKTLFWVFIIYKCLLLIVKKNNNKHMRHCAFFAVLLVFALLGKLMDVQSPLLLATGIPQAVVAVPLFAIGNILSENNFLRVLHSWNIKRVVLLFVFSVLWCVFARSNISLHVAGYNTSVLPFYIASVSAFVTLVVVLFELKNEKIISWFGRNSLHILGLHLCIITILNVCGIENKLLTLILTILLLVPLVYVVKRFFPFLEGKNRN